MDDRLVPVDVPSAISFGFEKWGNNFEFPVNTQEYLNWENTFQSLLDKNIFLNPNPIHRDIFNSQYKLFLDHLPNFLHAYVVSHRLELIGKKPLFSNVTKYENYNYYRLIYDKDYTPYSFKLPSFKYRLKQRLKSELLRRPFFLREFSCIYSGDIFLFKKPFRDRPLLLEKFFFEQQDDSVLYKPLHTWLDLFNGIFYLRPVLDSSIYKAVDEFIELFQRHLMDCNLPINDFLMERIRQYIIQSLKMAYAAMIQARRSAYKLKDLPCFFSGIGYWLKRAIILTIRREGGHITTFTHGGEPGKIIDPILYYIYFPACDRLYTYSQKSVECLNQIKTYYDNNHNCKTEVKSAKHTAYIQLLEKYKRSHLDGPIKTVMVIGYPAAQYRGTSTMFVLYVLFMEMQLIRILRKAGYKVIYKKHPDSTPEINPHQDLDINIIEKRFEDEDVLDACDAFIFTHSLTTTFPVALCTRKPVILFNDPYSKWNRDCFETLKKRCTIIDLKEEEKGDFSFNEEQLLAALKGPYKVDDSSFIKEFLGPAKDY